MTATATAMTALAKNWLDFGGNIMKKLTAAILALLICVFAFASCGSDKKDPASSGSGTKATEAGQATQTPPTNDGTVTEKSETTREWSDRY